ncbi:MAG TPA: SPOR domain-containing protein [Paucimonas sp.]|nr:SPOR domain-containing protein [Paucimonas sp.]
MAKFGFLLVLALFGALMFIAGTMAPKSFGETIHATLAAAKNQVGLGAKPVPPGAADAAKAPAAGADAANSQAKADPIPSENLILPTVPPDKGQYGLQLGQFADAEQAKELSGRIAALKLPTALLDTIDQAGTRWTVVAVGPYGSPDEARAIRIQIARALGFAEAMPLILMPAPPKPKA